MISYGSTNNCLPTANYTNPCSTILSYNNGSNNWIKSNNYGPSNCYRPLQQLYKTVYSPTNGNNFSQMNIACICRPAERYKTTNMTYGSFYYDNSGTMQKNRPIDRDRALFARCVDNNNRRQMAGCTSTGDNRLNNSFTISNRYDTQESQYWSQPTSDECCPTDCCHNNSTSNCTNPSTNNPFSQKSIPCCSSQMYYTPTTTNTCCM